MKTKKKTLITLGIISLLIITLAFWIRYDNVTVDVNTFTIESSKLPDSFNGYRIAQISDLHNASFGKENDNLIELLKKEKPDIVVITGDMIDSRREGFENSLSFAKKCAKLYPTYFVTGNHEKQGDGYPTLKLKMVQSGVTVIEDRCIELVHNEDSINLFGINDPLFKSSRFSGNSDTVTKDRIASLEFEEDKFNILLSHRPEYLELYSEYSIDLVFSGHAHGGQFRLPFVGGIYAPNQGIFPTYTSGVYTKNTTKMIVSRGLGPSVFPFRINNRPEIVIAILQKTNFD